MATSRDVLLPSDNMTLSLIRSGISQPLKPFVVLEDEISSAEFLTCLNLSGLVYSSLKYQTRAPFWDRFWSSLWLAGTIHNVLSVFWYAVSEASQYIKICFFILKHSIPSSVRCSKHMLDLTISGYSSMPKRRPHSNSSANSDHNVFQK